VKKMGAGWEFGSNGRHPDEERREIVSNERSSQKEGRRRRRKRRAYSHADVVGVLPHFMQE